MHPSEALKQQRLLKEFEEDLSARQSGPSGTEVSEKLTQLQRFENAGRSLEKLPTYRIIIDRDGIANGYAYIQFYDSVVSKRYITLNLTTHGPVDPNSKGIKIIERIEAI